MAKPMYAPAEEAAMIDEAERIIAAIKAQFIGAKCQVDIKLEHKLHGDQRRALISFTPTAWIKMTSLVSEFSTEVQWHGLVRRVSESEFEVYDIIVPPHVVTSATVTSDPEKYSNWLNGLDDETFNALRFHGHSHVNMAVSPSVTDKDYRKDVITQFTQPDENNDPFYIFLIINKRHEWSAEIYDLTNNAIYSTVDKEIDLAVTLDDGDCIDQFLLEAKRVATLPAANTYSPPYSQYGKQYGGNYGSYYGIQPNGVNNAGGTDYYKGDYGSKKKETKSAEKDDDEYYGVDEKPTDPFYVRDGWGWDK